MQNVSLTLIQTFFAVAQDGSYSAAARKLNMSYQSAANHVRRMEQLIGEQLVKSDQGGKAITLTPRGSSLYKLLQPEIEPMLARLNVILDKERPILRLGLPQAFFFYLLPEILQAFHEIHPEVEILAYERDTVLADLLKDGSLDVCVSDRYFGDTVVAQHLICTSNLALIYPSDWGPPPAPKDIAQWAFERPLITYEPGQKLRNVALDFLCLNEQEPRIFISTSGSSSVKRCVEAGLGFAIIPSWCLDASDARLVYVDLAGVLPKVPIYFGEVSYLNANPFVQTLRRLCAAMIYARITGSAGCLT
ncbi:MAG: molybdate transport repressor ModE-like protein [Rhodoferax sp.]|jgi:molybdate transport repressor ModE-like protein